MKLIFVALVFLYCCGSRPKDPHSNLKDIDPKEALQKVAKLPLIEDDVD
tara:strand:- start:234 stop:380 length:147 start_codon:yes stop_codon:yes gene_type:complete